jgi:hypothetical protein
VAEQSFQSAERDAARAAVNTGNVSVDDDGTLAVAGFDGEFEPQTNADGDITVAAAEASNAARLARGEDPVVDGVESVNVEARPEANQGDVLPTETAAEDTMAVRQSNVDRVVDNNIERAEEPVSDGNVTNASPSAKE